MSDTSSSGVSASTNAAAAAAQSSAPATAKSAAAGTTSTHISSLEDLKNKSPEVYNLTMKSIGMQICDDMKRHQDHLKETMRRGYQNS